jgi:hypothetical protein
MQSVAYAPPPPPFPPSVRCQKSDWTEIWSVRSSDLGVLYVQSFRSIAPVVTKQAWQTTGDCNSSPWWAKYYPGCLDWEVKKHTLLWSWLRVGHQILWQWISSDRHTYWYVLTRKGFPKTGHQGQQDNYMVFRKCPWKAPGTRFTNAISLLQTWSPCDLYFLKHPVQNNHCKTQYFGAKITLCFLSQKLKTS